ncbi:hypothetical protein D3P06_16550 [Paracoccus aestuarii]|uniref:Uncharacterized protein n=1 Tax=Paracoccus aestuarii TaxID=453842 RepID=A0A418ZR11_9RHOB|nr:hypothetical protein D3P06_16550 [Paracoccus aestuarii]
MPVSIDHGAGQEEVDLEPTRMRMAVGEDWWTAQGRNTCVGSVKDHRGDQAGLATPGSRVEGFDIDLLCSERRGEREILPLKRKLRQELSYVRGVTQQGFRHWRPENCRLAPREVF